MKRSGKVAGVPRKEMVSEKNKIALYRYSLKSKVIFFSYINYWTKLKLTDKTKIVFTSHGEFPLKDCTKYYDYLCGPQENKIIIATRTETTKKLLLKHYPIMANHYLEILGMPRSDTFYNCNVDKEEVLRKIGVEDYKDKKIIINMTTFRHEHDQGLDYFEDEYPIKLKNEDLDEINEVLRENNEILLIKMHPSQDGVKMPENKDCIRFMTNNDIVRLGLTIQSLYSICDAMITDYSTSFLGFLTLDRKIIFLVTDKEKYTTDRGWTVDNVEDFMPGEKITTKEELIDVFKNLSREDKYKDFRHEIKNKIVGDYKDQNCKSFTDKFLK